MNDSGSYTLIQSAAARSTTAVLSVPDRAELLAASARSGASSSKPHWRNHALPEQIGRYRITGQLYDGRYHQLLLGSTEGIGGVERKAVIKLLRPQIAHDGRRTRGFLHEERVTGALDHPNVVRLLDSGDSEFGYYMVLEHIQGYNLAEVHTAASMTRRRIPLEVALTIAHGVATALHYVHELATDGGQPLGLVHRNVLPSNVMIREDGFVKLIDFGEVAIAGMEREQSPLEDRLHPYTPPEMVKGQSVDRRGDIYGIGAVLYEASTGRLAVQDPYAARHDSPERVIPPSSLVPDYWPELEAAVLHMLQPEPAQRFPSAATVALALEDMATRRGITLSPRRAGNFVRKVFDRPARASNLAAQAEAARQRGDAQGRRGQPDNMGKTRIRLARKLA